MSDLSSITDRLNAAKNLPWTYADIESVGGGTVYDREVAIAHVEWDTERVDGHIRRTRTELEADRIGEFLAAAPSDIAYLLGRVKELEPATNPDSLAFWKEGNERLEAQREAVLAIHRNDNGNCSSCLRYTSPMPEPKRWPCATVVALGGETE